MKKMKMKAVHILMLMMAVILATSCVHEFPEEEAPEITNEVVLHLDLPIDTDLYREIIYPPSDNAAPTQSSRASSDPYTVHYRIKGWLNSDSRSSVRALADQIPDFEYDTYGNSPDSPSTTLSLGHLRQGIWCFVIWADIADDSGISLSHNADRFDNIEVLHTDGLISNSQRALAWRGEAQVSVKLEGRQEYEVTLEQPQGLFRFITTDIDEFLDAEAESVRAKTISIEGVGPSRGADINDYRVEYHVAGYYPTTFDNFINKPVDAKVGMYGSSTVTDHIDGTANLGGLHVMVNGSETAVDVVAYTIFNPTNEIVGMTEAVKVPVVRGKITIVRGKILTAKAKGGVTIRTDFDGDFNIEIR